MKSQRDVPVVLTLFVVTCGLVYQHFDNQEKQALHDFLANKPDFLLIKVMEDDLATRQRLEQACAGNRGEIVGRFEDRTFYKPPSNTQLPGLPQVKILDTFIYDPALGKPEGSEGVMPIYRCFRGPNAWDKFRAWLKAERYCNFEQDVIEWNSVNRTTADFITMKPDSYISFQAFFAVGEKLYCWDGIRVVDLSIKFDREGRKQIARWKERINAYAQVGE